jgi:hypothetical protein
MIQQFIVFVAMRIPTRRPDVKIERFYYNFKILNPIYLNYEQRKCYEPELSSRIMMQICNFFLLFIYYIIAAAA